LWNADKAPKITETRGWDEVKQETVAQRTKEGFADYRFFPEPDLPPLIVSENLVTEIKASMPELPEKRVHRFVKEYGLKHEDAKTLINQRFWADYFEGVMSDLRAWLFKANSISPDSPKADKLWDKHKEKLSKLAYNWLTSELFGLLGGDFVKEEFKIKAENFAELLKLIHDKKINSSAGQTILKEMFTGKDDDPSRIAESMDLAQIDDDSTLEGIVTQVIMSNPEQVEQYRAGKETVLKFLVGQVMKESKGKANPQTAEKILKEKLK
jgi:aspartyl-tRNA(Asn)/glutamyl-tRNA(Gln) amidotransferase subunit B